MTVAYEQPVDPPEPKAVADAEELPTVRKSFDRQTTEAGLPVQPIPKAYWESLPVYCVSRILEFESVRVEYHRTLAERSSDSPTRKEQRLTLNEIVGLANIHSREYQQEKEQLYVAALAVSLERYRFQLKFTPGNNGVDVDYNHLRDNGVTVNTLGIPSSFQLERTLARSGTLLAGFANSVLLTFNGPDGFAADVSSELLFDFTQSILQRDIRLEPLIQSERSLVYAARDFTRFRK